MTRYAVMVKRNGGFRLIDVKDADHPSQIASSPTVPGGPDYMESNLKNSELLIVPVSNLHSYKKADIAKLNK